MNETLLPELHAAAALCHQLIIHSPNSHSINSKLLYSAFFLKPSTIFYNKQHTKARCSSPSQAW
ncbi:hypothetical protein Fmac_003137 [Flemingia macrophylla]|uniref:Uncharacterized protein n=1 Tax=Flemingia macrophylla TaxID=520843 RepID=A0ABD1NLX1_9FABA